MILELNSILRMDTEHLEISVQRLQRRRLEKMKPTAAGQIERLMLAELERRAGEIIRLDECLTAMVAL